MNCPKCHTPNEPNAHFCMSCGAPLSTESTTAKSARRWWLWPTVIGGVLLVIIIVVLAIFWGPRFIEGDSDTVSVDPDEGITLDLAGGAQLTLLPESLSDWVQLRANTLSQDQFQTGQLAEDSVLSLAADQLPSSLNLQSPIYRFRLVEGPAPSKIHFSLPVDSMDSAARALDFYAWDGSGWRWLPSQMNPNGQLIVEPESLPYAVVVMYREPTLPVVTADLSPQVSLPAEAEGAIAEVLLTGFSPEANGRINIASELPEMQSTAVYIPSLRNWRDDGTLTAAIGEILTDPTRRRRHIEAIVGVALAGGYPAVQLDYRELDPTHKQALSTFITELAEALHDQNRSLYVRVEAPVRVTTSRWETGAYDWAAIALAADRLQFPLPSDPAALGRGETEVLLN